MAEQFCLILRKTIRGGFFKGLGLCGVENNLIARPTDFTVMLL